MSHKWMIDVLLDLKAYAQKNSLTGLAEQLEDTLIVASAQLNAETPGLIPADGYGKKDRVLSETPDRGEDL